MHILGLFSTQLFSWGVHLQLLHPLAMLMSKIDLTPLSDRHGLARSVCCVGESIWLIWGGWVEI